MLPKALCDKWAWVRWDNDGRRQKSEADATADYDRGVQVGWGVVVHGAGVRLGR